MRIIHRAQSSGDRPQASVLRPLASGLGALALGLLLVLTPAFGAETSPNQRYIHELEKLLGSLSPRDPSRPQLTQKLADALFNEALTVSGQPDPSGQLEAAVAKERRHAIQIYQDLLAGLGGRFAQPSAVNRGKIQFQLARLYSDLGETTNAEKLWAELTRFKEVRDIQREAILRTAENQENHGGRASLLQAQAFYQKAIEICAGTDVCSYAHYRLAWVYQGMNQQPAALAEMQKALWDSKKQIREEALRDLVQMLGAGSDDGRESLKRLQALVTQIHRPLLLDDLSSAYFAHGNRIAGSYVLDVINHQRPTLNAYVRLLEEDYGFRNWSKFDKDLDGAQKTASAVSDPETEKILRRLSVQLDGERATSPERSDEFRRTALLYLKLYPKSADRKKMIDGWLAAEPNDKARMPQLEIWIAQEHAAGHADEEIRLRKIRSSSAQKLHDDKTVIADMTALVTLSGKSEDKREAEYQVAYAFNQQKNFDQALPRFLALARLPQTGRPDKWGLQSEHLALDIYGLRKDYAAVVAQAKMWTEDARFATWAKDGGEWADIAKIESSAQFEWAIAQGANADALKVFAADCEANVHLPKSCENAKVLAIKLSDEKTLLMALRKLNQKDELAAELEASADFSASATMIERTWKDKAPTARDYLKVELLYELAGDTASRNRVLQLLIKSVAKQKSMGTEEDLIFQTLGDAGLLNFSMLAWNWKQENHDRLTERLAAGGKLPASVRAQLAKSCRSTGPTWEKIAIEELQRLDTEQSKIHFAGRNSKARFERRVAAIKTLNERGTCYLQGATASLRVTMATLLAKSEATLAEEIKAAPIPADVDEAGRASLEKALGEMAQPFVDKGQEFEKLAVTEQEKASALTVADNSESSAAQAMSKPSTEILKTAVQELHQNPSQREALVQLKDYYQASGNSRLAAYYQGRIQQLGKPSGEVIPQ